MAQSQVILYSQGDLLKGSISLRSNDACTPGKQNPYAIPAGAVVKMLFPGTSSSVTIDSSTSVAPEFGGGTEITITDQNDGDFDFIVIPTKGAGIALSAIKSGVPQAQAIDIVILDSMGAQLQTFEILPPSGIVCTKRANP